MTSRLRQPGNESALRMLEGMNLTIAVLVSVGRGPYRGDPNWSGNTWEEVDQVCFPRQFVLPPHVPFFGIRRELTS